MTCNSIYLYDGSCIVCSSVVLPACLGVWGAEGNAEAVMQVDRRHEKERGTEGGLPEGELEVKGGTR